MAVRKGSSSRGGRSSKSPSHGSRSKAQGYTLRGKNNRIEYVGITNNPTRRAAEHKREGKPGSLNVETRKMSRPAAHKWEENKLQTYRSNHSGKAPPENRARR